MPSSLDTCSPTISSNGSNPFSPTPTYNVDRFMSQNAHDDGTVHGCVPAHEAHPRPDARVPFYQAKAATAIVSFDAAFGADSPN